MPHGGTRRARRAALAPGFLVAALLWGSPARAEPMHVMSSSPLASAVMTGSETEFFIEFDRPVDHAASRLSVLRDGQVVQVLHPRLRSRPNFLYSGVRRLAPGDYSLRWSTRPAHDREASEGEIAFTVR